MIRTKRIYEPPAPEDGYRLLVMRLWSRGVHKDAVDAWDQRLDSGDRAVARQG